MAFEERIDVHAELHDVRSSTKNFENKGFNQKEELGNIPHSMRY
jgi:Fe-S cluster assembly protein SufD